jgi:hypothetical protein
MPLKRKKWRKEEMEAAMAGQENPFEGIDERGRDYFYARRPKKLRVGPSIMSLRSRRRRRI